MEDKPELRELYAIKEAIHRLYRNRGHGRAKKALTRLTDATHQRPHHCAWSPPIRTAISRNHADVCGGCCALVWGLDAAMNASLLRRAVARWGLPSELQQYMAQASFADAGHGYDALGLHPEAFASAIAAVWPLYTHYFRVDSHGAHHIPKVGAALVAANHSGMLPIDGAMLGVDIAYRTRLARIPRMVGDIFIPLMPWVGTFFSRIGVVSGTRGNFRYLLETGELAVVFPEGVPGISKGFRHRYELQTWRVGHAELSLRFRVPVIPVGIVGAEEAWPQLAKLGSLKGFGVPFVPVPAVPLPLPVKIHIHYGEPLYLADEFAGQDPDDPHVVRRAAGRVRDEVERLLHQGRRLRKGWFR